MVLPCIYYIMLVEQHTGPLFVKSTDNMIDYSIQQLFFLFVLCDAYCFLKINICFFLTFQVIHGVHIESPHIMRKRSVNQPLRILLYYDESVYRYIYIHMDIFIRIQFYRACLLQLIIVTPHTIIIYSNSILNHRNKRELRIRGLFENQMFFIF